MEKNYIKVSALNQYIKLLFDDNTFLHRVYLKGEISNFKHHMSGHYYFTLKDEEARISAIMFRSNTSGLAFTPEDGKKVLVEGRVSCYPAQGTYQVYVDKMEEDGLGNLYILYEELKNKLAKEGLFLESHKKPLPKYPSKIGIVTAPTGAAIRDILSTIKRRFPICKTILFPALVQGKSAAPDIVRQIKEAQKYDIDVLIVGRGGGSIEDLWAFNEEIVARAIYDSDIPVISAVGHEIDYTISDFVADMRAPTPTGAAEMAVPTVIELRSMISHHAQMLSQRLKKKIDMFEAHLKKCEESYILKNPTALYDLKWHRLDYLVEEINHLWHTFISQKKTTFSEIANSYFLKKPLMIYQRKEEVIVSLFKDATHQIEKLLDQKRHSMKLTINTLQLVNPLNILEKGYSLVTKEEAVVTSSKELQLGDMISIRMKEGSVKASVKEVE